MTTKKLTRHQTHWAKFLSGFKVVIFYIPDKENQKTDSQTCCPNNLPSDNNDNWQQHLL